VDKHPVFAQMVAAAERGVKDADAQKKTRKAEAKRQKEKGGHVQTGVLDRNSVKLQASQAFPKEKKTK
jgi:hypothetical protein